MKKILHNHEANEQYLEMGSKNHQELKTILKLMNYFIASIVRNNITQQKLYLLINGFEQLWFDRESQKTKVQNKFNIMFIIISIISSRKRFIASSTSINKNLLKRVNISYHILKQKQFYGSPNMQKETFTFRSCVSQGR